MVWSRLPETCQQQAGKSVAIVPDGEYDPAKPDEPLRHEVWARNKVREEVRALKLKKDDCIEAVLYRHTWDVELQGGGTQMHTRHNLAKVIKVDRKGDAKRS
jgi:hypothetical protein